MGKSVGFVRFNQHVELDYMEASVSLRGTGLRLGILEALVKEGHDVTIYSPIKGSDVGVLDGNRQAGFGEYSGESKDKIDYTWATEIDYKPRAREEVGDEDVLLIECASTNSMFQYDSKISDYRRRFEENVPYMWRTFDLIDKFEGHVVYYQEDVALAFPFFEATRDPSQGVSDYNITKMANNFDFFENKEWTILNHSFKPSVLERHYDDITRYQYGQYPLSWTSIPVSYSENIDVRYEPRKYENLKHDLLYIGGPRSESRHMKIKEFYQHKNMTNGIIGNWEENEKIDGIAYYGPKGKHGDTYRLQNWGMSSVQVSNELEEKSAGMTHRISVLARAGNIILLDKALATGYYVDDKWWVGSKEEVRKKIGELKIMDYDERLEVNRQQMDKLNKWEEYNWDDVLSHHDENVVVDVNGIETEQEFNESKEIVS